MATVAGGTSPPIGRRLTPSQQFTLLLLIVLLASGAGLSALAALLVQQTVLAQTGNETQHAIVSHFDSIFGAGVFDLAMPGATDADEHSAHDHRAEDGYAGQTAGTASGGAAPVAPAFDQARFDRQVQFHLNIYDIVHARFFRPDGRIVYSYAPGEVGRPITDVIAADDAARALRGDAAAWSTAHEATDPRSGKRAHQARSLLVAVAPGGQVAGAAWVERDITALMASVWQTQLVLTAVIFGIVALLFLTLRHIYTDSTQTIRDQTAALTSTLGELSDTYDATLRALAAALDSRDTETGGHGQRVTRLAVRLGRELGVTGAALQELERGALLHDIGKIGVPDALLRKPGPLTDEEWTAMRRHATIGAAMLDGIPFLSDAVPLVRHHHERWDGVGYPDGLVGAAIPLGARIFAVADALDAMTSQRPYRAAMPLAAARAELARCAGSQFDPAVVAACARIPDA
ncbi:MAG: HD-GYP domain-containing protein, partial [Chloroflexi bacterium]|nr:HD-GYP domain-containing protein [Chloroflexota bacterium]